MVVFKLKGELNMGLFILGLFVGANISLFLYACILVGKNADKNIISKGGNNE